MQYEEAGRQAAAKLVLGLGGQVPNFGEPYQAKNTIPSEFIATELIAGLIYGVTGRQNADQLTECFVGADEFVADVMRGYNMLTKRTYKELEESVELLLTSVSRIPINIANCETAGDDAQFLSDWASGIIVFADIPENLEFNIVHQSSKISLEMAKIRREQTDDHYFMLGEYLGEVLSTLTEAKPALFTIDEVMDAMKE